MNNTFWRLVVTLALGMLVVSASVPARGSAGAAAPSDDPEEAVLRRLNDDYARAFVTSDVGLYRELSADDFQAVLSDGSRIGRAEFLRQAAQPSGAVGFRLLDVGIRLYGDAAVVSALANYRRADGAAVRTRYVALYIKQHGRWRIVSVQFTRAAPSSL